MNIIKSTRKFDIYEIVFCDSSLRSQAIMAGKSSRDIARDMIRVKSSNVWAYNINIRDSKSKTGDVYVQFKGNTGGPGDVYVYYDVPVIVYRRWHSAPSKGHYFWKYIRNNYKYSKLTGDKKTHLRNGVTYKPKRDVETSELEGEANESA